MKTIKMLALAATATMALAAPAMAVTYTVNLAGNGVSATGSIVTDGTLGTLAQSNITDWTLNLTDVSGSFTLDGTANSQLGFFGTSELTATTSGLFFNFSGNGAVLFQNPTIGSGINFICFTGAVLCGGDTNRISISVRNFGGGIAQSGVQQIATSGAVPEPAAWAMMIGGMGLVGGAMRRRKLTTKVSFA